MQRIFVSSPFTHRTSTIQTRRAITTAHRQRRPTNPIPIAAFSTSHSTSSSSSFASAPSREGSTHPRVIARAEPPTSRIDDTKIVLGWDTTTYSKYHHIWLRDHCRCPECYHPHTKQRLLNTFEIPPEIKPFHVEPKPEGLEVQWPSSHTHTSFYPWSWLRLNSYDPPMAQPPKSEKILWGSKILQDPPTVTYEEAMAPGDRGLFKWLSNVDSFGLCFVSGVPASPEATEELSRRIGFIRETQYGKFWDFTSNLAKGDTAYTTLALGAHTDTTYFTDPCGLQLFHLLEHTDGTGGATLLVDGFYVASILKELHPEAYELLSAISVPTHAAGEATALFTPNTRNTPVLKHEAGELVQVRWNNDDRSVLRDLQPGQVEPWYNAIRTWYRLLTSPDSEYWVQLSPGTAVGKFVDNHRVLHGRSAFNGKRRMCGAYVGMDEYRSKLAVLSETFSPDSVTQGIASTPVVNGRSVWHPDL